MTEEALFKSLAHSHELNSIDLDDIHLPNLPRPPKAFRGIRKKSSSLKRWLASARLNHDIQPLTMTP
ncbi:unnamed protein product [Prunus armeniaca]|nr:unnamed protein product [Prunus armeniaca]